MVVGSATADTVLGVGQSNQTPNNLTSEVGSLTLLGSVSGTFDSSGPFGASWDGTYTAAVYKGATVGNGECAACLTFLYQYTDSSAQNGYTGSISNTTATSFAGFQTVVGYSTVAPTNNAGFSNSGSVAPSTVDRLTNPTVEWDYAAFNPGMTSDIMVVETTATSYLPGVTAGIGEVTASVSAFGATSLQTTPEPTTMVLFGSALVGLGLIRKRIRG